MRRRFAHHVVGRWRHTCGLLCHKTDTKLVGQVTMFEDDESVSAAIRVGGTREGGPTAGRASRVEFGNGINVQSE